jgi:hypothetical protein
MTWSSALLQTVLYKQDTKGIKSPTQSIYRDIAYLSLEPLHCSIQIFLLPSGIEIFELEDWI